jgi:hypothetical protein
MRMASIKRCNVCGKIYHSSGARQHRKKTGHSSYSLIVSKKTNDDILRRMVKKQV